jgi:hypothetical protein
MLAFCVECGDDYPDARLKLGYRTCLPCGDAHARDVKWAAVPMSKSNYVLVTNPLELKQLNPKRVEG